MAEQTPLVLPVHVVVAPELQEKYGVPSIIPAAASLPEPITCMRLLHDVLPRSSMVPEGMARLLAAVIPWPCMGPSVVASTHHAADAVTLVFSIAASPTTEVAVRSFTAGIRTQHVRRGHMWETLATQCPEPLCTRLTLVTDTNRVFTWTALYVDIGLDVKSEEQCKWAREFFYATLWSPVSGKVFVAHSAEGALELCTKIETPHILLFDGAFYPLALFRPAKGKLNLATMIALRECTTSEALEAIKPKKRVCVCGYGTIPEALQAAAITTTRDETERSFRVLVDVPEGEKRKETLRRFLPGAPDGWATTQQTIDGVPNIGWVRFTADTCKNAETLAFFRTTTYCVLTYLTPVSVVIRGYSTHAAALEKAASALADGARFWYQTTQDTCIAEKAEDVVNWLVRE